MKRWQKWMALAWLFSLALPAWGDPTVEIGPFLGRTVSVPIPEGYCPLQPRSSIGEQWYRALEQMNARINVIGLVFIDCEELRRKEEDPRYVPTRHGAAMIPATDGNIVPSDSSRADYIRDFVASGPPRTEDLSEVLADGFSRLDNPDAASRGAGVMLGILDADENAAYLAQVVLTRFPTGTVRVYVLSLTTLVHSLPLFVHLYAPERGEQSLRALLAESKRLAAELARENSP